jgi:uncharacterized protein YegJ (DUF2314 family)
VVYRDGEFDGVIGNDPGLVTKVRLGQKWKVKKSDWMFVRAGKIHGNYTLRPLPKTMKPPEVELWRSQFAKP